VDPEHFDTTLPEDLPKDQITVAYCT